MDIQMDRRDLHITHKERLETSHSPKGRQETNSEIQLLTIGLEDKPSTYYPNLSNL